MRFQVAQFIDVEDKIFGPLTLRQFIYLVGGGGLAYLSFKFLPIIISIILGPAIVLFSLALAFLRINNQPFIVIVEAAIKYFLKDKVFIWKKEKTFSKPVAQKEIITEEKKYAPTLKGSKLKEIAQSLDIITKKGQ